MTPDRHDLQFMRHNDFQPEHMIVTPLYASSFSMLDPKLAAIDRNAQKNVLNGARPYR